MHRGALPILLALLVFGSAGCFARGHVRFSENPDLAAVRMATGRPMPVTESFGMVEGRASGAGRCSSVAADALRDLLAEAHARGASRVEDVKFRARWHWTGHALCRRYFPFLPGLYSVQVQGVAVATGG
jgi:hypothetical protein